MKRPFVAVFVALAISAAACSSSGHRASRQVPRNTLPGRTVFVIGSGDAAGDGLDDPLRDAWPRLVYTVAFPPGSVLVNAATRDATFSSALATQVPLARDVRPDTALIWLGSADLAAGTAPAAAGSDLAAIVRSLHDLGVRSVVVANLPDLAGLPSPAALNSAITSAANANGARVVDIHTLRAAAATDGDLTASLATHRAIAAGFERVLRSA